MTGSTSLPISYCPRYENLTMPCVEITLVTTGVYVSSHLIRNRRCLDLFLCVMGAAALLWTQPALDYTSPYRKTLECFPDKRVMQVLLFSQGVTLMIAATTTCVRAMSIEEKRSSKEPKKWTWQEEMEIAEGYGLRAIALIVLAVTVKLIEDWSFRNYSRIGTQL